MTQYEITTKSICSIGLNFLLKESCLMQLHLLSDKSNFGVIKHINNSGGSGIFRWGGAEPLGGTNLRRGCFLAKMYAKLKELDPVGGGGAPAAPPPWIRQ